MISWTAGPNSIRMSILLKAIYKPMQISVKSPNNFFFLLAFDKRILTCIEKCNGPRMGEMLMKKVERFALPSPKIY